MKSAIIVALFITLISSTSFNARAAVTIKASTLNSWMIPFLRKFPLERANIIGSSLGARGYNIALFQEMFSPWYLKITTHRFFESRASLAGVPRIPLINSGLASLFHGRILKKDFKEFTNCGGFQCLAQKGMQFRRVEIEGEVIDVYNVHLQPFQKEGEIRRSQLEDLRKFIQKHSNNERPVLLGGDFNIIAESREYQTLIKKLFDFRDVWSVARPNDPGYSWNPRLNPYAKPDPEEDFVEQRVDYLFVRDGRRLKWKVLEAKLELTAPKKLGFGRFFGSDHFGVGATLQLR